MKQGVASLKCQCGRVPKVNEAVSPGATYTCAYCNPVSWRRDRRRPRKTILFCELKYSRDGDGDGARESPLTSEEAAEQFYSPGGEMHATTRWERTFGVGHQNFLDSISTKWPDKQPPVKELRRMSELDELDEDERLVLAVRAMGISRRKYAARLNPSARTRFENAWRRLCGEKTEAVRKSLKARVRAQIEYD